MHLFDTTDPEVVASRRKFYITIAVLSAATYATVFVAYWLARSRKDDLIAASVQDGKVEEEEGSENASAEGEEIQAAPEVSRWRSGAGLNFFRRRKAGNEKGDVSNDNAAYKAQTLDTGMK